jgi:hypothetical protein
MLSMPGSNISYHACYVVYSLVLLTINLHSVSMYQHALIDAHLTAVMTDVYVCI